MSEEELRDPRAKEARFPERSGPDAAASPYRSRGLTSEPTDLDRILARDPCGPGAAAWVIGLSAAMVVMIVIVVCLFLWMD